MARKRKTPPVSDGIPRTRVQLPISALDRDGVVDIPSPGENSVGHDEEEVESIRSNVEENDHQNATEEMEGEPPYNEVCLICHREGIPTTFVEGTPLAPKWFGREDKRRIRSFQDAFLCAECGSGVYWPAYIWVLLFRYSDLTVSIVWSLLPDGWRQWWRNDLARNRIRVTQEHSAVTDVTDSYKTSLWCFSSKKMADLPWNTFRRLFEEHLTVPSVRCPWGCAEYLPRCRLIPLDAVVYSFVRERIPFNYRNQVYRLFLRRDWLLPPAEILCKWKVRPSVVVWERNVFFLSCRFHSSTHYSKYIYVPRNPTGSVSFKGDNSLAQVHAVPRTLARFRKNAHSNSYACRKIMGGFGGIDSINLVSDPLQLPSNNITRERDLLVMVGRAELQLEINPDLGFPPLPDQLPGTASVPDKDVAIKNRYGFGSTYISLQDVFRMQKRLKEDPARAIAVYPTGAGDEPSSARRTTFISPWPACEVEVCWYGDDLGDPFPCFQCHSRCVAPLQRRIYFYFLNAVLMIPELWRAVDSAVASNSTWHGWVLLFLARTVKRCQQRVRISHEHPFYLPSGLALLPFVCSKLPPIDNDASELQTIANFFPSVFEGMTQVYVQSSAAALPPGIDCTFIVVYYGIDDDNVAVNPVTGIPGYAVRYVSSRSIDGKWEVLHIRHEYTSRFYRYIRTGRSLEWGCLGRTVSGEETLASLRNDWLLCIWVKQSDPDYEEMRKHVMTMLGGQNRVKCAEHRQPLVTQPYRRDVSNRTRCCNPCCRDYVTMGCPVTTCSRGVCRKCYQEVDRVPGDEALVGQTIHTFPLDEGSGSGSDSGSVPSNFHDTDPEEDSNGCFDNNDDSIVDNGRNGWEADPSVPPTDNASLPGMEDESYHPSDVSSEDGLSQFSWAGSIASEDNGGQDVQEGLTTIQNAYDTDGSSDDSMGPGEEDLFSMSLEKDTFPSTSASQRPIIFDTWQLLQEGRAIPNHVILNCHGNLLIRRHRRLRPTRAASNFLQRLAASSQGRNIPLLYPEAMMYPSLFWLGLPDGSIPGAIPSCCLMDEYILGGMNIASLYDHSRGRLSDPSLLSSTMQSYWGFAWDSTANLGLRGESAKIVLRRGFADFMNKDGLLASAEEPKLYDGQCIDSRRTVNQLAAAAARRKFDFFFTWTMNGTSTPAVRQLTDWVRSPDLLEVYQKKVLEEYLSHGVSGSDLLLDEQERLNLQLELEESACIYVVRSWMEFVESFLLYLQFGKDSPFRAEPLRVGKVWNRSEIQDDHDSKTPHQHTLITLKHPPRSDQQLNNVLQLIRGSIETFLTSQEYDDLVSRGMVNPEEGTMASFLDTAQCLLTHHCTKRCQVLRKRLGPNGEVILTKERKCKSPDNRRMSAYPVEDSFVELDVPHDQEALRTLRDIGMIEEDREPGTDLLRMAPKEQYKDLLAAKRHCPACYETDGKFSPANPFLFAMLLCAMNLQFVTAYLLARYLASYVASTDKANRLSFLLDKDNPDFMKVAPKEGYNTKIKSNQIAAEREKKEKRNRTGRQSDREVLGRALPMSELIMQFFQYPTVRTTYQFVSIPTLPMGMRPATKRPKALVRIMTGTDINRDAADISDLDAQQVNSGYQARQKLKMGQGRQFSTSQLLAYTDNLFQEVYPDKVQVFCLRPPELRFIRRLPKYFVYFDRSTLLGWNPVDVTSQTKLLERELDPCFTRCPWIDALGCRLTIRRAAVPKVVQLLERYEAEPQSRYVREDFGTRSQYTHTRSLFRKMDILLQRPHDSLGEHDLKLLDTFVSGTSDEELPVYWFRSVRASEGETFLYHILLSMGEFETEIDLYRQPSLRSAFQYCRLFTFSEDAGDRERSARDLCRRYIESQLSHYPLGSHSMDREIVHTYRTIREYLLEDRFTSVSLPSALFTKLRQDCDQEVEMYLSNCRRALIQSFLSYLRPIFGESLPPEADVVSATNRNPVQFDLTSLPRTNHQEVDSYREHQRGYQAIMRALDHYSLGTNERTKSVALVGAGGVGKTIDLRLAGIQAACRGLFVLSTTLTGKRAAELAGEHLHVLFCIPINEDLSVTEMAARAYDSLLRDPVHFALLRRVDVLCLDELGNLNTQTISVADRVLRRIRHSTHFMGGVLLFATYDGKQIKPITGVPALLSPSMMCSFHYVPLDLPLRTHDPKLREIQAITRMTPSQLMADPAIRDRFRTLVETCFTYVDSFDDARLVALHDPVYCFPHHESCYQAEQIVLERMKRDHAGCYTSRLAEDRERTLTQVNPSPASPHTREVLNRKARCSEELVFCKNTGYEATSNDKKKTYFHGQLCLILDEVPSQEDLDHFRPIPLLRAPAGEDTLPHFPTTREELVRLGWQPIMMGVEQPCRSHHVDKQGLYGMREQYGLRHRIASTLHSVMGATATALVTKLESTTSKPLWESTMVVVLTSRTREAKDIYVIGNPRATSQILWTALTAGGRYNEVTEHVLDCLLKRGSSTGYTINLPQIQSLCQDPVLLPGQGVIVVYMLVSIPRPNESYIGFTNDVRRRLNQHNSYGGGSRGTGEDHRDLAPWGLYCFLTGFVSREEANSMEGTWKAMVAQAQVQSCGLLGSEGKRVLMEHYLSSRTSLEYLTMTVCGHLRPPCQRDV